MPAHRDKQEKGVESSKDLQGRRARGEVRCAECHRLKLKCDRKQPCSTCTRRGCATICPNGALKGGSGSRLILADTEDLHKKLAEMSARIRTLEEALELLQGCHHPGITHPLLQTHLLLIKSIMSRDSTPEREPDRSPEEEEGLTDAFGALAIAPNGAAQYFGRSAGTQMIFVRAVEEAEQEAFDDDALNPNRPFSNSFTFPRELGVAQSETFAVLKSCLPSYDRAWSLCETYLNMGSFYFRPLLREDLLDYVFAPIYDVNPNSSPSAPIHPHHVGLVFFICALGALYDLDLPPRSPEAERYYRLAKATTSLKPILGEETIFETVMTMGFMTVYHLIGEKSRTQNATHTYMTVTCLLAQNLGLHRDPSHWGLPDRVVDMRRRAFWELSSLDHMMSTVTACPVFFAASTVDCEPPIDKDVGSNPDGSGRMGFWAWKIHVARKVLDAVYPVTKGAKLPSHQSIMKLDAKIRAELIPSNLQPFINPDAQDGDSPDVRMQRLKLRLVQADILIYLHRTYFTQCVLHHPTDPDRSPFAASYKATYDSGVTLLKRLKKEAEGHLHILVRLPYMWMHAYSAAIIVGTAIARGPNQPFASSGLVDFANAVGVFERAAESWHRARIALPYLTALLRQAHSAYCNYLATGQLPDCKDDEGLEMFGGRSRVFFRGSRLAQAQHVSTVLPHPVQPQLQAVYGHSSVSVPWQSIPMGDQSAFAPPRATVATGFPRFGPSTECIGTGGPFPGAGYMPMLNSVSTAQCGMGDMFPSPPFNHAVGVPGVFDFPSAPPPSAVAPTPRDESWEAFVRSVGLASTIGSTEF